MASILVVDDDKDGRDGLALTLTGAGHSVRCVSNGREALASVLGTPPNLIVLDLIMPGMDGVAFLEVIRSYLRLQNLPVLAITGASDGSLLERSQALQVSEILMKGSLTPEGILEAVDRALMQSSRTKAAE